MEAKRLQSILESLLFLSGEGLSLGKLVQATGETKEAVRKALEGLREEYTREDRGVSLVLYEGQVQMVTRPENATFAEKLFKSTLEENLSKAALETLAVIAYRGPIDRAGIDAIRGVNSSFTLRNLLLRGLIERRGNPHDARGYVYFASVDMLRFLGLSGIGELPDYAALREDERLKTLVNTSSSKEG